MTDHSLQRKKPRGAIRTVLTIILLGSASGIPSCASEKNGDDLLRPSEAPNRNSSLAPGAGAQTVAIVNGQPVSLNQLTSGLLEVAGGTILEEIILDILLETEAGRQGITVSDQAIAEERGLFIESLIDTGVISHQQDSDAILSAVRASRGLGTDRFHRVLRRSALLRRLIENEVVVTEEMLALAHRIEQGEKRQAHIITTATLVKAQEALGALNAGEPFVEVAARLSTDASAPRGGLIDPISALDPTYPDSIRTTLAKMNLGELSPPVVLDTGYAILRLDAISPPTGITLDEARPVLMRRIRRQEERRKMAELAERLRRHATVTILDSRLQSSASAR